MIGAPVDDPLHVLGTETLELRGITVGATNVEGGMEAWASEGLPFAAADGSPGHVA